MATSRAVFTCIILYTILHFVRSSDNISVWKTATQSGTYWYYVANMAVDGCTKRAFENGCCSHTDGGQKEAWWRVDLGQLSTIHTIKIFYRSGSKSRFAGYQLYLSNSTESPIQGVLCYEDTSSTSAEVELVVTHQCPYVARYVTVYNYRNNTKRYNWYDGNAFLELCEVEVLGCEVGKYGPDDCNQDCSVNCFGGNCDPTNGSCFYCAQGLHGSFCSCLDTCTNSGCDEYCSECIQGTYGDACENTCSTYCVDNKCSKETGQCFECPKGRYNTTCDADCPIHCDVNNCTREEGFCYGCTAGYHGVRCDQECPTNCKDSLCDENTGHCFECLEGKYNTTCDSDCPIHCALNNCTREEGLCYDCEIGYHGSRCDQECPTNCNESLCDMDTGHCYACVAGRYGRKCSLLCGQCDFCVKDTGVCETVCYSGFEGPTCQSVRGHENPVDPGPVAGGALGAFVLIVTIVIIILFIIRRRRADYTRQRPPENTVRKENHIYINSISANHQMPDDDPEEPHQNICNIYVNTEQVVKDENTSDVVYINSGDLGVAVSDLKSLVECKMQNKAKVFKDEYASLPSGALHKHTIGLLSENKLKNRFKATFPYDHSRVKLDRLDEDPKSDYINANYIDSMTQTAVYIATQGPRPATIDDFWLMIWQQQTGKIVMLTNLVEGGKPKCSKYWPDEEEPLSTAHFNIVLDRKRVYAFYIIHDLTLTEKKTNVVRQIYHFHFTAWPDHGTPDPNEIVVFHRRVKQNESFLTGKMVVHCSAGIGRTGTFIALDALLEYGRDRGRVDVMGYTRTMRKDRMNMVQTSDQYIAIHHMLIEAFDMPDSLIPRLKYNTALTSLSNGAPTNQTKLRQEYQLTQILKPTYKQEDFKGALLAENRNKNYTISVLAVDKFRAYLRSQSKDKTDYINAVVVPSYTSMYGYIVTQTPLEETVIDLLTLIKDQYCETVVIIEKDSIDWMPAVEEEKRYGEFTLLLDRKSTYFANLDLLEVILQHRTDDFLSKICVFHLSGWDNQTSAVPEPSSLLHLLERVDIRRRSDESIPTLVMCRDGCSQSGLFCCISNAREQMKIDEEVDVFQITRQLLMRRPEFIINFEQYQYVYRMIKEYLDNTDLYMN